MKCHDLWPVLTGIDDESSVLEILSRTSYDELLEFDLDNDTYKWIHQTENKFLEHPESGTLSRFIRHAGKVLVHSRDAHRFAAFWDISTLKARLEAAAPKGILAENFRIAGVNGKWIQTRQLIVGGEGAGMQEGICRSYIYDTHADSDEGDGDQPESLRIMIPKHEEITGLLEGVDFYRFAQSRLKDLQGTWCVIYAELEQYKLLVDWYGLETGRSLLSSTGKLLKQWCTETESMAGYLGQEQFCLVTRYDMNIINDIFSKISSLMQETGRIKGLTPIFGISVIDNSGKQIMEYYNNASLTAREANNEGHTRILVYDARLHKKHAEEYRILHEFEDALENGEITFWLQPQYRIVNDKIVGAESLARWKKPDGTFVPPAVFVPILEKFHVVTRLDKFIWESVCAWISDWLKAGRREMPVSVNVSIIDIFSEDIPAFFDYLVEKYQIPRSSIKIEITESAYAENTNTVKDVVYRFRSKGYTVLMDDFGSGYSSLNMLRMVDIDVIKLDAQFLHIDKNNMQKGISIMESVIDMAMSLGTPIIVEGVETREQVAYLKDLGCSYIQGYYYNRPMPTDAFLHLVESDNTIDEVGIVFKPSHQIHARELLDENLYSDAMLNNILGPVVFYLWNGENVDIIRYNEQFYDLVGIGIEEMNKRSHGIQQYLFPEDRETLYDMLQQAYDRQVLGAKGTIRTFRPNGVIVWLSLTIYFLSENEEGKKFYASAQDVTEVQYLRSELPGGYYRCTDDDEMELLFVSENFLDMTGFTHEEIKERFNNRLINMIHPNDRSSVLDQMKTEQARSGNQMMTFRVQRKRGDYIVFAEQSRLTDRYGAPSWQCMSVDVTSTFHTRNQLLALSAHLKDTIMFVRREGENLFYEVAIHGLRDLLGVGQKDLEQLLNSGEFCKWIEGYQEGIPHQEYTRMFITASVGKVKVIRVTLPDGKKIKLGIRVESVTDVVESSIEYILMLKEEK